MKRNCSNKVKILLCILMFLPIFLYRGVNADVTEPGGADDPLITKSFAEGLIGELRNEIDDLKNRINALEQVNSKNSAVTADSFKTVYIEANNEVYLEEGTEIILRSGKAIAISDHNQGFADITSGIDTFDKGNIIKNHLMLCPREDDRHLNVMINSYFIVKGKYTLKKLQ